MDTVMRPERTTYVPKKSDIQTVLIAPGKEIKVQCMTWSGKTPGDGDPLLLSTPGSRDTQCLYWSADENEIQNVFANLSDTDQAKALRNRYLSYLVNVADQNCATFLNRAFANKSTFDTTKGTLQDVLTGVSAATANGAPHAAAGLGLVNLVVGKSVDNINAAFFFEKTFQALSTSISAERANQGRRLKALIGEKYDDFDIHAALAFVHTYDEACTIRVGLEKLQAAAQDKARNDEHVVKGMNAAISMAGLATQLAQAHTQEKVISQQLTAAKNDQLPALQKQLVDSLQSQQDVIEKLKRASEEIRQSQFAPPTSATSVPTPASANSPAEPVPAKPAR